MIDKYTMQGVGDKILKYGDCTITRFDIVGSFFVYLFYNELFKKAKLLKDQSASKSMTDIYKELLTAYSEFTSTNEFFKQAVKGIHNYVVTNTNQIGMTHKECIDFIVSEFVPSNIFNSLRDVHKNKLFHDALSNVVKQFISKIISKYLRMTIDNRDNNNIVILQNEFLDIICIEKDNVYSKFINGNQTETMSIVLHKKKVSDLKQEYEKKMNTLMATLESQKKTNATLETVNQKSSEIIKQLQAMVKNLKEKNLKEKNLKEKLAEPMQRSLKEKLAEPVEPILEKLAESVQENPEEDEDGKLLFDDNDSYY